MPKKFSMVYQFKISLNDVSPPIWRRIQVPESYTFWDLHVAIQDAMGWLDCHLHQFEVINPKYGEHDLIGMPDGEWDSEEVFSGWKTPIKRYFSLVNKKANYDYDFGDGWRHKILLEKIMPAVPLVEYPICIAGKRACPPEDCGGPWGYQNFLEIIANPKHEEYSSMMEWVGGEFHPEIFFVSSVHFDDPKERLNMCTNVLG
jgi:hypothetical protein